jgi:IS30 family transposase
MHTTGMSFKAIGRQMGYHYAVVSRLMRKHTQTNNVKDVLNTMPNVFVDVGLPTVDV